MTDTTDEPDTPPEVGEPLTLRRLVVCGDPRWAEVDQRGETAALADRDLLCDALAEWFHPPHVVLVHDGAETGATALAARTWTRAGGVAEVHPHDPALGRDADPWRDLELAATAPLAVLGFVLPRSHATEHTLAVATVAGLTVHTFRRP